MEAPNQLLTFSLDGYRYALHLSVVDRVFRAVEITPLPEAPEIVLGIFNMQGRIIPVVNVRKRFRLPEREVDPADHLILTHTSKRPVALWVDSVGGVIEGAEQDLVFPQEFLSKIEYIEGVLKMPDGVVLIHDIDSFLSLDEEERLGEAMKNGGDKDAL